MGPREAGRQGRDAGREGEPVKILYAFCLYLLFFALSVVVQAATPSATLTWVAPTTNTDGTAITLPLTYNVYQGTGSTVGATPVQTGVTALTLTITAGLTDGTTACFAVTAVEGGQESVKSNVACKTFPQAVAEPPVLTVQ